MVGCVAFLSAMVTADRLYHFYLAVYYKTFKKNYLEENFPIRPLPDPVCAYQHILVAILAHLHDFAETHFDKCHLKPSMDTASLTSAFLLYSRGQHIPYLYTTKVRSGLFQWTDAGT